MILRELIRYQAWADAELLRAVKQHPAAAADEKLLHTLQHMVLVQRFFLSRFLDRPFDPAKEQPPATVEELEPAFRATAEELARFADGLRDEDLTAREYEVPFQPPAVLKLGVLLTQVVLHGQNHRGQCLARLSALGAKPPTLDYILWTRDHGG